MPTLSNRHQLIIGVLLALLILATRGHHFATLHALPSASWAAFFLAGIYLRPVWAMTALLLLCAGMDSYAFIWGNASGYCLTAAYAFLVPAYGAQWFAGRWYAKQHQFAWHTLLPLSAATLAGSALCELFSSGGFYFFSGRFAEPNLAEFASRLVKYFPGSLQAIAFYILCASLLHAAFTLVAGTNQAGKRTTE